MVIARASAPGGEWWRTAVLYEIYVRSFADTDGDGLGDLPGVRSRLPYLRELGVDGIWLTPFYPTPDADHGYDVSDYKAVDPRFGTLADFDALVSDAHDLGLRVVVDIVPNHTSNRHPWFTNALEVPNSPQRARYVFRPARDGGPPNNWESVFGGPAWTKDERSGEYYLHLFAPEQPDLDWHNEAVRTDFVDILRFWLDRGVDGFRIDVAQSLFKERALADVRTPEPRPLFGDWHTGLQQPELLELYQEWRRVVDGYPGDRLLVGEMFLADQTRLAEYVRPGRLHQTFNFRFLYEDWDAAAMRSTIDEILSAFGGVGAAATWVLENHDVPRVVSRLGGDTVGNRRARAAALLMLALPGAAYLYAGQELGLEEVDLPDELRQDPVFTRSGGRRPGRDGCRVPIPWAPGPGLGFTTGAPWLPIPADWERSCVAAQACDPGSTLRLYRTALELRRALRALGDGGFVWRESQPGSLVFERGTDGDTLVCAVNVDASDVRLPEGELLLASRSLEGRSLPRDAAAWLRV
jgi:alpha-glucosidase